jgi:hypothetical protein
LRAAKCKGVCISLQTGLQHSQKVLHQSKMENAGQLTNGECLGFW